MEIKKIFKRDFQNLEHYQFASHVYAMCKEANIAKLNLVLPPLLTAINAEDAALNQPRKEDGTKELEQLDATRDQSYRALQLLVELHLHSDDAAMKTAAEAVSEVLSRYPKAAQMNYDKESGALKNLIADLRTAALTPHVTKLAAAAYITRLEKDNNAFDTRYRSRLKAAVPAGTFDIKQLRAATDAALNAVVRRMDSLDDLEPATPNLSGLITQYNALVEKRRATLSHRSATSQTARDKRAAEYEALLKPGFAAFENRLGLPSGSLSFTGKTEGSGAKRRYELAVEGQTAPDGQPKTVWVGINKDGSLYVYEKATGKPSSTASAETGGQAGGAVVP